MRKGGALMKNVMMLVPYMVCCLTTFVVAWLVATFVMIRWRYATALRETVRCVSASKINMEALERENIHQRFRGVYWPNFWGALLVLVALLMLRLPNRFITLGGAFVAGFVGVVLSIFLTVRREVRSGHLGIIWADGGYKPKPGEKWNRIDGQDLIRSGIAEVMDGDMIATFTVKRFGKLWVYAVKVDGASGNEL
jgi:hypothetical protein